MERRELWLRDHLASGGVEKGFEVSEMSSSIDFGSSVGE